MGKRKWEEDESIQASARAAVTLNCMNSKFRFFLSKAKSVLDLCAATGGWMHLAVGRIPQGGLVLGVDLSPVKIPAPDAITIQGDVNSFECRNTIREIIMAVKGLKRFDVVMRGVLSSNPHATAWDQASVLTKSIRLATKFLAPEGSFVTKMFDGAEDYNPMLYCLEQLFSKVVVTKPTSWSTETYIVALGYKAPKKVDRQMLVPRNLFVINENMPKGKKCSSGETSISYSEEESVAGRVILASDFVWSETPYEVLGIASSLSFNDDACVSLKNHSLTTKRVRMICKDLRVVEEQQFKRLLKWRLRVREAMSHGQKATPLAADEIKEGNGDYEVEISNEM